MHGIFYFILFIFGLVTLIKAKKRIRAIFSIYPIASLFYVVVLITWLNLTYMVSVETKST